MTVKTKSGLLFEVPSSKRIPRWIDSLLAKG